MVHSSLPRVFVGSSSEALQLAHGIKANLEDVAEVRVWAEDLFEPGNLQLDDLLAFTHAFDFAVFVFSPDDLTTSRGESTPSPRDNVMLEAGMFYGSLGKDRVFLFLPQEPQLKTPTDLLGLTVAYYRVPSDANYRAATSSSSTRLASKIARLGPRTTPPPESLPERSNVYDDFAIARDAMSIACRDASEIAILCNKGLVFFGLDESLISIADLREYKHVKRLHMLVIDPACEWITQGMAALRRYESVDNYRRNLAASHHIIELGLQRLRAELPHCDSALRYHVSRPCFRLVMTETVAFVSSYADEPSHQVRDLPVMRFHAAPGSLHAAFSRYFYDLWGNASRLPRASADEGAVAISAGGIVFSSDAGRAYVALVQRHDGAWVLPKGHRAESAETLDRTALREVHEELGVAMHDLEIERALDDYTYDEGVDPNEASKVVYLYVMRYRPSGRPDLKSDPAHKMARWWRVDARLPSMRYAYQRTLLAEAIEHSFGLTASFE